jgi:hypothetical protein
MINLPKLPITDIFQIYIQHLDRPLTREINISAESLKNTYPNANYNLLNNLDILSFLGGNFSTDVLQAYLTLTPFAYKADLARYCLLYVYGGLYADLSVRLVDSLDLTIWQSLGAFRDLLLFNRNSWAVCQGLLCAAPQQEEFKVAIDMVVNNCKSRNYGASPLEPTGPGLFGRAIAIAGRTSDLWMGEAKMLTPEKSDLNVVFISPDGRTVAKLTKTETGNNFSIPNANSYPEIWCARNVYGERD